MPSALRSGRALIHTTRETRSALAAAAAALPRFRPPQPVTRRLTAISAAVAVSLPAGYGATIAVMTPAAQSYTIVAPMAAGNVTQPDNWGKLRSQLAARQAAAELAHRRHRAHLRRLRIARVRAARAAAAASQEAAPPPASQPPGPAAPAPQGPYSWSQLEALWISAGGPADVAATAATIAICESGGNPNAYNPSGASGLWQILGAPFPGNLFDPATNARMAVAKYTAAGGFSPWVCQG